jgi:hypothetical protein
VTHIAHACARVGGCSRGFSAAMRDHSAMSQIGSLEITAASDTRCCHVRDSVLLTLVLCSVVRATQALAGDQSAGTDSAPKQDAGHARGAPATAAQMFSAPFVSAKSLSDIEVFSATEFRPRRHSFVDVDPSLGGRSVIDAPMLQGSSLWQQMAEFRAESRVRLLTLWQTRGSSLSLQAGKRGAPSLQWSSPSVHRNTAARGLFDRLLPAPELASQRGNVPRPAGAAAPLKPSELGLPIGAK